MFWCFREVARKKVRLGDDARLQDDEGKEMIVVPATKAKYYESKLAEAWTHKAEVTRRLNANKQAVVNLLVLLVVAGLDVVVVLLDGTKVVVVDENVVVVGEESDVVLGSEVMELVVVESVVAAAGGLAMATPGGDCGVHNAFWRRRYRRPHMVGQLCTMRLQEGGKKGLRKGGQRGLGIVSQGLIERHH